MFKVEENSRNWLALTVCSKLGVTNIEDVRTVSNKTLTANTSIYIFLLTLSFIEQNYYRISKSHELLESTMLRNSLWYLLWILFSEARNRRPHYPPPAERLEAEGRRLALKVH